MTMPNHFSCSLLSVPSAFKVSSSLFRKSIKLLLPGSVAIPAQLSLPTCGTTANLPGCSLFNTARVVSEFRTPSTRPSDSAR